MLITPISLGYENKSNTLKYIEMGEVVGRHSFLFITDVFMAYYDNYYKYSTLSGYMQCHTFVLHGKFCN